jgi:hypothetical protein
VPGDVKQRYNAGLPELDPKFASVEDERGLPFEQQRFYNSHHHPAMLRISRHLACAQSEGDF